jgi:serine/threonine protein kinase/tetratricopeptide (TPR) repeat protein
MAHGTVEIQSALAGRYVLERELGRGGMATVYLAVDRKHGRQVALKVLRPEIAQSLGAERFLREIEIVSQLQHPHILGLHDSGRIDWGPGTPGLYYAMPYVEGESLRGRLERETQLSVDQALHIAQEVADALEYAHRHGVVHRDIKPENILLSGDHAIVADFGIAKAVTAAGGSKLTETGLALGTPYYMSPESAAGMDRVDGRSDIYALGCVLYEMLAGQPPFVGPTAQAILARHSVDPVPSLHTVRRTVPSGVEWAITKAMAKVPSDRFATAADFANALAHPERVPVGQLGRTPKMRAAVVAGALVVLVGLGVAYAMSRGGPRIHSLAVLPVENLTGDTTQVYLADGMTDQFFTDLAQVKALKVISRASVAVSQQTPQTAQQVARALQVDAVLTGSLRRTGDSLRLSVQLISMRDGQALWATSYDRAARDIPRVHSEAARAMLQHTGIEATAEERVRLGAARTVDPGAFALYTRGRYSWNKRDPVALKKAQGFFIQAIDIDPTYAAAYAGLADTYNQLGYGLNLPPWEAFPKAKKAASDALQQDSSNAEAHVALGYATMYYDWDWTGAERDFRTAVALNPSWATAHEEYSLFLLAMGRFDEAESEVQQAVRLDPLSAPIAGQAGWVSHYRGRQAEAAARLEAAVAMDSVNSVWHFQLGRVYQAQGRYPDALKEYGLARNSGSVTGIGAMGNLEGILGNRAQARKALAALDSMGKAGKYVSPYVVALVYTGLGDKDAAFVWLNKAVDERTHWLVWLNRDPRWIPLRSDPRFRELGRRVGLPQ